MVAVGETRTVCTETRKPAYCVGLALGRKQDGRYSHEVRWMCVDDDIYRAAKDAQRGEFRPFPRVHDSDELSEGERCVLVYHGLTAVEEGLSRTEGGWWEGIEWLSVDAAKRIFPKSIAALLVEEPERTLRTGDSTHLWK